MMKPTSRPGAERARLVLAATAAITVLGGCEPARMAAPEVRPSPAQNASVAAAALGVGSRPDVLRAQAGLAAHVDGWQEPATAAAGSADVRLDAETAARVDRLQARMRAYVAQDQETRVEPR